MPFLCVKDAVVCEIQTNRVYTLLQNKNVNKRDQWPDVIWVFESWIYVELYNNISKNKLVTNF